MHKKIYRELNLNITANSSADARHFYVCVCSSIYLRSRKRLCLRLRRSSEPASTWYNLLVQLQFTNGAVFLLFCSLSWFNKGTQKKKKKKYNWIDALLTPKTSFNFAEFVIESNYFSVSIEGKTTVLNRGTFFKRCSFGFEWSVVMVLSWNFGWVI